MERIGYLAENPDLPKWMTSEQYLAYLKPFYSRWDDGFCQQLLEQLRVPMGRKIRRLSSGNQLKVALISRLAYRPELLILDEPFAGIDPLVRDELVDGVLQLGGQEGLTVFVSSHDLDEIERLVDHVGFLLDGTLLLSEPLESLQNRFREIEVILDQPPDNPPSGPDTWMSLQVNGRSAQFVDTKYRPQESERQVEQLFSGAQKVTASPMSLRSIFVTLSRNAGRSLRDSS